MEFSYVEAYFVPDASRSGVAGNNSHPLDTTLFVCDGAFAGGDLTDEMIDRIKVFNDDWSAPEPPYPNSCKDDDEFCSQVAYDFNEGEVVTFVVSHYKVWDAYKFNENYIPLSFYSSVP